MGVTELDDRVEVEVSGVLIASKHKHQEDAGTHERNGESGGTSCERTPGVQPGIVRGHLGRDDGRRGE